MSNSPAPLDLTKLKVSPLAERRSESRLEEILVEPADSPAPCPDHTARIIRDCAWELCTLFDINFTPKNMRVDELQRGFPPGLKYDIVYDTTPFIDESIKEVFKALRDAIILVAIVVLAFLQSWRAKLLGRMSGLALMGGGVWLSLARRPA